VVYDRRAAARAASIAGAGDRAGSGVDGNLSADGCYFGLAPGRTVPGQRARVMFAPARIASLAVAHWQALSLEERLATGLFLPLALLPVAQGVLGGYLLIIGERAMIPAIAAL